MGSEGEMCSDTSFSPSPRADGGLLGQLTAGTCGSAGLDVCTAAMVVLDSCGVHKVPLDAFGPVGEGMSAFLMGRSSATIQGIIGHLGLIEADFKGQIYAMVSTPSPPSLSLKGPDLLNLCLLSLLFTEQRTSCEETVALDPLGHWPSALTKDRPEKVCTLSIPGATDLPPRAPRHQCEHHDSLPCHLVPGVALGAHADICCRVGRNGTMRRGVHRDGFLMGATVMKGAECPTPPIQWLVDKPVWDNQWPLSQDKLDALHDLVQEQLQGHLESSTSPWNTPVFCIKMSGKWRLLQDLRKVNAMMESRLARVHSYYILHVRSHTNLPGFIAEGNVRADKLANTVWVTPQPDTLVQAKASHGFFHQNAHALQKQFQLMPTEARDILESCDDFHTLAVPLPAGVNPRGLRALEIWQTDVTQIAEFGRLKHTPSAVKTNNGPAYASQKMRQFLQLWGVSHKFGIPHSLTDQVIVEHAYGTLKRVLQKQNRGMQGETPHSRLAKALYTINHLMVLQNSNNPVILNHHLSLQASDEMHQPRVKILGYAGYQRSVFVLSCDCKGKIWPIGKLETLTKLKVIKWMNHQVLTHMQMM
ncbi:hypothetical protein DUI87_13857 [Hirundo rustica rustica]|uniref:RNA-directed DNA polymerase n=1 Tax=Hirundo rustica rustica TaxID=333673 RepID=A0A3M0K6N5_HIRRU|nr:hypothetical protein DUI87_13857 [Hirundo rustica rustica]